MAIDGLVDAFERRNKDLERIVEARAAKRVKAASETAERAIKQAQQREMQAANSVGKQKEISGLVAGRLDQAIIRLEKIIGE